MKPILNWQAIRAGTVIVQLFLFVAKRIVLYWAMPKPKIHEKNMRIPLVTDISILSMKLEREHRPTKNEIRKYMVLYATFFRYPFFRSAFVLLVKR